MDPIVKASGGVSPGAGGAKTSGNGSTTVISDANAHVASYIAPIPASARAGDIVLIFASVDSGAETRIPLPTLAGHSFESITTSGGAGVSGRHGRVWWTELDSDGAKSVTMSNGGISGADTATSWVLLDGSSVLKPFAPTSSTNTTQIAASASHTISSQGAIAGDGSNAMAFAYLTNNAGNSVSGQGSQNRTYGTPTGWTKIVEVGSREFLDTGLFTEAFIRSDGFPSATVAYTAAASYTRLNVIVPGAPDFKVEYVGATVANIESGGSMWVDKPAGSAPDDDAGAFLFTGQSTTKQRVVIQRFKNVHRTRPIANGYVAATTGSGSAVTLTTAAQQGTARGCQAGIGTSGATSGSWNGISGITDGAVSSIHPASSTGLIADNYTFYDRGAATATTFPARNQNWSVAAPHNHADIILRAADSLASGVDILVAWHIMDASQNGSLQNYPDWSGWIELGRTIRSAAGTAYNIRCYYQLADVPKDKVWESLTDQEIADTVGINLGYTGTQRQAGGSSNPTNIGSTDTANLVPAMRAPGGRPGMACKYVIPNNYTRFEQNPNHRQFVVGEEYFFGFSFYLDEDFPLNANSWQVIEQLHAAPGAGSPVVAFEVKNGQIRMTGGANKPDANGASTGATFAYDILALDKIERNTWYHVVYYVKFHNVASNSRVDAWVNGNSVITNFQPPCATVYTTADTPDGGPTYRKQGFYHDRNIAGGTIWHGYSALGRTFAAVDPARTLATRTSDLTSEFTADPSTLPVRSGATTADGVLKIATSRSGASFARTAIPTAGTLAWTSVSFSTERLPAAAGDGSAAPLQLWVYNANQGSINRVGFDYDSRDNTLRLTYQVSGSTDAGIVSLPFSATHKWWRIRNTGAYIIWETSPSGIKDSWVERRRMDSASIFNIKDASYSIETFRSAGADDFSWVDNMNTVSTMLQKSGQAAVPLAGVSVAPATARAMHGPAVAPIAVGATVAARPIKTSRGPNVVPVPIGVVAGVLIGQKLREGAKATITLGVAVGVVQTNKNASATVAVPMRVATDPVIYRKTSLGIAPVALGVGITVSLAQRQRRATVPTGVVAGVRTARTNRVGTAAISMATKVESQGSKSVKAKAPVALGVEIIGKTPERRKVFPEIRENYIDPQEGMRYYLQDVRTKEFIHTEFPLENEQITLSLSGPDIITGDFGFDIRDVEGIQMDGWSQWIHAELDNNIATSGLLLPWTYNARMNALEANGASVYPHGIPWSGDKGYIQADPMDIISDIWDHVQQGPMSNLGVRFIKTKTNVKLGTEEKEQVEFTTGEGGTSSGSMEEMVMVKRESVGADVWNKLKGMGYNETSPGGKAQAAQEMINRINSGGGYYEDFSWTGMSANMNTWVDSIADGFYAKYPGNDTWRDKNRVRSYLQTLTGGGGSLYVKRSDLITAQGGTPTKTQTNAAGTGSGELVSFEAGGPYKLSWFEAPDCGSKIDELFKACPADYREINYWSTGKADVKHDIITGYPRLGRPLEEPVFEQDENIVDAVPLEEEPEDFATEIWVLGAGEGRDRIRGFASLTHPRRVRRVKVYEDKSITSKKVADAIAKEMLAAAQRPVSVKTVLIDLRHDFARLGSFAPGDDVRVKMNVRGYGDVDLFHRVEKMNFVPKSMLCAVDLIRSDTIRYGVA